MLLDEATSALDKKNEAVVQESIERIRRSLGQITTVVIAHRLSTIKDADKILVMKYGELKEEGTHDSLLKEYPQGIYANFVRQQENAEQEQEEEDEDGRVETVEMIEEEDELIRVLRDSHIEEGNPFESKERRKTRIRTKTLQRSKAEISMI